MYSSGGEFGDSFGSFGDGVLSEFYWEDKSDSRLNLSGGESVSLVVSNESGGFGSEFLEDIVNEGVHDGHGSLGDTGVWVNLFQDSVDVDGEGFGSSSSSSGWSRSFGWGVSSGFGWHFNLKLINYNFLVPGYKQFRGLIFNLASIS